MLPVYWCVWGPCLVEAPIMKVFPFRNNAVSIFMYSNLLFDLEKNIPGPNACACVNSEAIIKRLYSLFKAHYI